MRDTSRQRQQVQLSPHRKSTPTDRAPQMRWVEMWTFLFCGVAQGLLYLVDFSARIERHRNYAAKYADMHADVNDTLQKPYRCRPLADVFVMRVKTVQGLRVRGWGVG